MFLTWCISFEVTLSIKKVEKKPPNNGIFYPTCIMSEKDQKAGNKILSRPAVVSLSSS